jgi:hypothetical protein
MPLAPREDYPDLVPAVLFILNTVPAVVKQQTLFSYGLEDCRGMLWLRTTISN